MDIRGTFFKEDAQKWINVVEADKVYTFSGGRLKVANPQWNKCKCQVRAEKARVLDRDGARGEAT